MGQLCCCLVWPGPSHYCGPGSVMNARCNWAHCPGISCLLSCPSSQQSKALVRTCFLPLFGPSGKTAAVSVLRLLVSLDSLSG